ncbi:hypothetical protein Moror_7908 [Moniliophthora roreri MCA 2997]|uniref:Uncharacterized protein n=1 Tax=Moniliophthora roreri (strain MCA 2997) TaxID=1381753 RepID=V2WT31_MONRO|nr:hypothetical protein Moror_7908 [Moniliophthora roreri MCA 2997]
MPSTFGLMRTHHDSRVHNYIGIGSRAELRTAWLGDDCDRVTSLVSSGQTQIQESFHAATTPKQYRTQIEMSSWTAFLYPGWDDVEVLGSGVLMLIQFPVSWTRKLRLLSDTCYEKYRANLAVSAAT